MNKICLKCKKSISEFLVEQEFHKKGSKFSSKCKDCTNGEKRLKAFATRLMVLQHYSVGGAIKCSCPCSCSETNVYIMQLDHIDGPKAGAAERRLMAKELNGSRGDNQLRYCIKTNFAPKLRVLCASCHASLSCYGECYREIERKKKLEVHLGGRQ